MARTDQEVTEFAAQVAREAWESMNAEYREYLEVNDANGIDDCVNECEIYGEIYLYIFNDGSWTIDHSQYIPTTNNCVANIGLSHFNGPAELAEEIEHGYDDSMIEDEEGK